MQAGSEYAGMIDRMRRHRRLLPETTAVRSVLRHLEETSAQVDAATRLLWQLRQQPMPSAPVRTLMAATSARLMRLLSLEAMLDRTLMAAAEVLAPLAAPVTAPWDRAGGRPDL